MSWRFRSIAFVFVAALSCQATASADLIFDNTVGGNQGITTTSAPQIGDEVTAAAGTSRSVTELDIAYTSQGVPVTANLQAFLYANDGPGGAPGTLLWQSSVMTGVTINSTNDLIAFTVPSVVVPDTFTWTSTITNATGVLGYVPGTGATTGTFDAPWVGSPGSFSSLDPVFETQGRVVAGAVPEPASCSLLLVGLAGAAVRKRFRRTARGTMVNG